MKKFLRRLFCRHKSYVVEIESTDKHIYRTFRCLDCGFEETTRLKNKGVIPNIK